MRVGQKRISYRKNTLLRNRLRIPAEIPNLNPLIEVTKTDEGGIVKHIIQRSLRIWNELEEENEVFLEYSNCIKVNNTYYLIKLRSVRLLKMRIW